MHSTQNWFGISKRRPRRDWGCGYGRRPEWTEKLRVREEIHRDREKDTGKEVETQRKGRQGKLKKKKQTPKTKKPRKPREKEQDLKANEFRSSRKGVGEETKTLPFLYCPRWGGGVKAPGLVGVGGHLGSRGGLHWIAVVSSPARGSCHAALRPWNPPW